MNKVIIVGNVVRDLELKKTSSGTSTCTFTVAVNRRFKNAQGVQETDYINVVTWRQTAELCAKYLSKGRKAGIIGSLQTRTYTAQDGTKRCVTEVIADEVEFLSPRSDNAETQNVGTADSQNNGFVEVDDSELPF